MNYGWRFMTLYSRQGAKPSQEKEIEKGKCLSEKALQIAEKRRKVDAKGKKERYIYLNAEFQTTARRDKKSF